MNSSDQSYNVLKQHYITPNEVGIIINNKNNKHKPILITNYINNSVNNKSTIDTATNNTINNVLDGFYLLELSGIGFPQDVYEVNASNKSLTSVILNDLEYFTNLKVINVSENNLNINDFTTLISLYELILTFNNIKYINLSDLSYNSFQSLNILDLSYNMLTIESIINLQNLPNLIELDLSGNDLNNLPNNMNNFYKLEKLILDYNKFDNSNVFELLGSMNKLRYLSVAYNYIWNIPIEYCQQDYFRFLETFDISFNYIGKEEDISPILQCPRLSTLVLYGNPLLGPTGEDPLQMYIESLVDEADEIAIRYNKSKPTEILTDIPRGKKIKKGQLIGRKANYRDFEITLLKKEPLDKSNREWKEYGNKTLFSELMSLVNSNPSILQSNTSLTKQSTQPKLVDLIDSFFITEDVLSSIGDQIASNVMNQVYNTSLLGVKTSNDFNIIQEKLIIPTRVTESQSKPVNNTKSVTKDNLNTYLTNENELLPSTLTGKSLTNTRVNNINNNKELKETYPMSLNTAVKTLKFMVEHPITDYTEIDNDKHYNQINQAYNNRKTNKVIDNNLEPIIISKKPNNSHRLTLQQRTDNRHHYNNQSKINRNKHDIKYTNNQPMLLSTNKPHLTNGLNEIDKLLDNIDRNQLDITNKSLGHGMNLKENMEVLRSFVRPHTALKGLESIVNDVINDIDK